MRLPLANAERYFRAAASERQTALSRKSHGIDAELFRKMGIPFTAPEGSGTPVWWRPLDTRSLDLITRARFRRWTNASVTTRPAASPSIVCAGLRDSPAPIAERRGSHGGWQGCGAGPAAN